MKIIATSNLSDERVSDKVIIEGLGEDEAKRLVERYNTLIKRYSMYFYRAVPDTYELYTFKP